MKTTADTDAVVSKINSLQTVFKKVLVVESNYLKPGASVDNVYKLKLWYLLLSEQYSFAQLYCNN